MRLLEITNIDNVTLSINIDLLKAILKNKDGNANFVFDPSYFIETNETYEDVLDKIGRL